MNDITDNEWFNKYLYSKEVECPCCQGIIRIIVPRKSKAWMESRDSDFFIRYKELNLYFYEVWICENCGYSALSRDFNLINGKQILKIRKNVSVNWQRKPNQYIYDVNSAIDRYKLALLCYIEMEAKSYQVGLVCLKLAWMNRLKDDSEEEGRFLSLALKQLQEAYYKEDFPFYNYDKDHIMYILGEINRRLDNNNEALKCFSYVLGSKEASSKLKEQVRDQRELIKDIESQA